MPVTYYYQTTTSRADLEKLICDYGDETNVTFNVTQRINNPNYKISFGLLPLDSTINENVNIRNEMQSNRFILANTEFSDFVFIESIDILPNKTGFINLMVISYQFQCDLGCGYQLNQTKSNMIPLNSKYKLKYNMTLELKNLSLHTFYFKKDTPFEPGLFLI